MVTITSALKQRRTTPERRASGIRGTLDLYLEESAAFRLLEPEEQHGLLVQVIGVRNRWMESFLATEGALEAIWADLQSWKAGEVAGLALVPGAPKGGDGVSKVNIPLQRLHRVFQRQVERRPRRPFSRGKRSRQVLLGRAVVSVGFRPGPLARYRHAAEESGDRTLRRRIERRHQNFLDARHPLIEHNLRLVMRVARNFSDGPMSLADLVQEGNLGLIRATESFGLRFGVRFSTYAYLWIRQSIIRALEDKSRTIRLPVSLTQKLRRLNEQFAAEAADGPAAVVNSRVRTELEELLVNPTVAGPVRSLQEGPGDSDTLGDNLPDMRADRPEHVVTNEDLREIVKTSLVDLPDRQRLVLRLRFGIDCAEAHSLSQIGRLLGLSAERVRQIQEQALENLRCGPDGARLMDMILD